MRTTNALTEPPQLGNVILARVMQPLQYSQLLGRTLGTLGGSLYPPRYSRGDHLPGALQYAPNSDLPFSSVGWELNPRLTSERHDEEIGSIHWT